MKRIATLLLVTVFMPQALAASPLSAEERQGLRSYFSRLEPALNRKGYSVAQREEYFACELVRSEHLDPRTRHMIVLRDHGASTEEFAKYVEGLPKPDQALLSHEMELFAKDTSCITALLQTKPAAASTAAPKPDAPAAGGKVAP